MSSNDIQTLNKTVSELGKRWDELEIISLTTNSPKGTLEILDEMDLLNIRITTLETLRNHLKAAIVVVDPPNETDKQQIQVALGILGQHIEKDMKWKAAINITKKALDAARTIKTNIDGRQQKVHV